VEDYIRAAQKYLLPLLLSPFRDGCRNAIADGRVLTIHGRWNDIADSEHPQAAALPCVFYDELIMKYKFREVRMISENRDQPCIRGLETRSDIKFRLSTSLEEGVCELLHASNLVVPDSTFSKTLALMNTHVQSVFTKAWAYGGAYSYYQVGSEADPFGAMTQCVEDGHGGIGRPAWHMYNYTNMTDIFRGKAKRQYMLDHHLQVKLVQVCSSVGHGE